MSIGAALQRSKMNEYLLNRGVLLKDKIILTH